MLLILILKEMKSIKTIMCLLAMSLFFVTCQKDELLSPEDQESKIDAVKLDENSSSKKGSKSTANSITSEYLDAINDGLALKGMDYRIGMAEYVTVSGGEEAGNTVLSKVVGNKQLTADFVPGDVRRGWSGADPNDITYSVDTTGDAVPLFGGLGGAATDAAIVRATGTWDAVICSDLGSTRNPDFGIDIGVVAFIVFAGADGSPFILADVQHAGWRDIDFSGGILGVTFTFIFVDGIGNPTDVDNNGKIDAAFREIYYDPSFSWADDGTSSVDVETVALHEIGHGLSQGHFGKVMVKNDLSLKASPRAVMNALYTGPYRDLAGTDNGGHCSNWGEWPNN